MFTTLFQHGGWQSRRLALAAIACGGLFAGAIITGCYCFRTMPDLRTGADSSPASAGLFTATPALGTARNDTITGTTAASGPGQPVPNSDEVKRTEAEHNTEAYARILDNPFLQADKNPLSTVSADVSTASYSNVRRFLNEGKLPPPDAVRVAEFDQLLHLRLSAAEGRASGAFTLDLAECPWNGKHQPGPHRPAGQDASTPRDMPPRNFVFLVDTSGSMDAPNRLPLVKQALRPAGRNN